MLRQPLERVGKVNSSRVECTAVCCVAGSGTCIGKEIEEALSGASAFHEARRSLRAYRGDLGRCHSQP